MAEEVLVSCVVPVFNGALYLEEAIASIEAQTWGPIEIIVVDDGSTDDTPRLITALGDRVRAIRQKNRGTPATRNRGMAEASGAFFTFLDADDQWHPEKIARQMARFAARPDLDLCLCRSRHWWIPALRHEAEALSETLNEGPAIGGFPTVMARRSLFERTGPLDEGLRHLDMMEWMLRVADVGGVVESLPDPLVLRRIHHDNASRQRGANASADKIRIAQSRMHRRAKGA